MGEHYRQLSLEERCTIARLCDEGHSVRQIASALDRPASTISRELKRNSGAQVGYKPAYAEEQARARRWSGMRLERDDVLRGQVLDRLRAGCSPEAVSGRLKLEQGRPVISPESIYRFLYAQIGRTKDYGWRHYLPRAKSKRGRRGKPGGSPASFIRMQTPIDQRPAAAADRQAPGHWEADFMLFARYGHNILVAHERSTRLVLMARPPDRKAKRTADALASLISPWPPAMRATLTLDNGTEFAEHHRLTEQLGIRTFFCDPHAPWQKGGIENAIGRLRRYLPRKTNLDALTAEQLAAIASQYNNTPRKCLGFKTPAEALAIHLLHFKCESTCHGKSRRRNCARRQPGELAVEAKLRAALPQEIAGWRKEQRAWGETVARFDLSHHMTDLFIEGPDVRIERVAAPQRRQSEPRSGP